MPQVTVGIAGATGYTGAELLRLLLGHSHAEATVLGSHSHAGRAVGQVLPQFQGAVKGDLVKTDPGAFAACDVVFVCLPHGNAGQLAAQLHKANPEQKVIDLSGDLRLKDPAQYEAWYRRPHPAPELLAKAAYGLPELFRPLLRTTTVVANPGCYPTGALLALAPLVRLGLSDGPFLVDSKSGVSGAGKEARDDLHFPEVNEAFRAYGVGNHRHTPEIEQGLRALGSHGALTFTPHLVPINRGILTTAYAPAPEGATQEQLTKAYHKLYDGEPFVQIVDAPDVKNVRGSNQCHVAVHLVERTRTIIALSAIDNLVKGAAGQAVQCMNVLLGLPETDGLPRSAVTP